MKVVHLVAGSLTGGAGRGAYWLHQALISKGIDSKIITNSQDDFGDPTVYSMYKSKLGRLLSLVASQLDKILLALFPKREKRIFSTGLFGLQYKKNELYRAADIVHLHWVNGLVSSKSISSIDKPIVWSIRDMWPMTGGCHYSLECERYISGCGSCPQLNAFKGLDFTKYLVRLKNKSYSKVQPVGISDWVTDELKRSAVFREAKLKAITINNCVDFSIFEPVDKNVARNILNITSSKKIILVGSTSLTDFYKGFSYFIESLEYLNKDDYLICAFGKPDVAALKSTGFEYLAFGYLYDNLSLKLVYSAADVFAAPSIQEAFGKTLVESMACNTPVVCFDATGPASIVKHKITGYKAKLYDAKDFSVGLSWVLNKSSDESLSDGVRDIAFKDFDSSVAADQYILLYENMVFNE
ncbi:glycosyltransferase [Neptuniibacter sp. QD72_48]|uniref:glycosyltransferase n=1 Tax=Neptuniibacter sp. QD72_48 TaxID=3398214 RepID=UPI0039F48F65